MAEDSGCVGAGNPNSVTGADIDGETWQNPPTIGCDEVVVGSITGELEVVVTASRTFIGPGMSVNFSAYIDGRLSQSTCTGQCVRRPRPGAASSSA